MPPTTPLTGDYLLLFPAEGLSALVPGLKDRRNVVAEWLDPASGASQTMSLEHVVRYVFYVDGKQAIPANVRPHIGKTFCEEPTVTNPNPTASVGGESFFDTWVEDEAVAEGEDSADLGLTSNRSAISPVGLDVPSQTVLDAPQPERQNTTPTIDNTAMDLEVIDLLRKHRPELLAPYPARNVDSRKRPREHYPEGVSTSTQRRNRCVFVPTAQQERIHRAVTSDQHQGKSGDAYVDNVLSVAKFVAHPGVASRAYDLQFGKHGLSTMHVKRMGFLDKLRALAPGTVNTADYLVAAPPPMVPGSWTDLNSSTRSFRDYCRDLCDVNTVRVAEALDQFVLTMEGWQQLRESELPLLVLWIDATLEQYRGAVLLDIHNGTSARLSTPSWFSSSNPDVHSLLFAVLGDRANAGCTTWPQNSSAPSVAVTRQGRQNHVKTERKIPTDVIDCIPTRGGKEVCLHYLSVRGCNSEERDRCVYQNRVHFDPAEIPSKVRQYIKSRLGGLRKPGAKA